MVQMVDSEARQIPHNITADVIILGCTLPGIVTAHKLKKRFGDSMDIVVLDFPPRARTMIKQSSLNVAFQGVDDDDGGSDIGLSRARHAARSHLAMYAKEFKIPVPDVILYPDATRRNLNKLFQYPNGNIVNCTEGYHDFAYLNLLEKFELNQYQDLLDQSMGLFKLKKEPTQAEKLQMLYFDRTPMEEHICAALLFSTSREIMRTIVRLMCSVDASSVSVLFYLNQCYRTIGSRHIADGDNIRLREKLLGYCRKKIANVLEKSVADITLTAKSIREIRTYSDEQLILETIKGDTNYICNQLAMALRPDELHHIQFDANLMSEDQRETASAMTQGKAKKFFIQYQENFWTRDGYSGDILSISGPIIWAMERPRLSDTNTDSLERHAALIGYLKVPNDVENSQDAVVAQLVKLFGPSAASPTTYTESDLADVFVPRCGDYVALRKMTSEKLDHRLDWGALDIFGDGDVAAAIEAGHMTYMQLVRCLRPQAQTFDDVSVMQNRCRLSDVLLFPNSSNTYVRGIRLVVLATVAIVGFKLIRSYWRG